MLNTERLIAHSNPLYIILKGVAEAHEHCTMKIILLTCTLLNHRVGTVKSLRQSSANLPYADHSRNQGAILTFPLFNFHYLSYIY
jgi:hypothetical protein